MKYKLSLRIENISNMKNKLISIILLVFLAIFTSCSKINLFSKTETPHHYNILKIINDTMTNNPKYALELLNSIDQTTLEYDFSIQEFHEYQILLSEANYKNFINQTNYDEITKANKYFDSLSVQYPKNIDIRYLNAKSHYYKAVGLEELEKTKEAFNDYLKSLELLDEIYLKENKINEKLSNNIKHFKALIYTRLGDILYWHDVYNPAIECITNANKLFSEENNQNALSRNNIILAVIYGLNYNHDKALYHLSIADSILEANNVSTSLKNDIERVKASVMYNIGYKDDAFNSIIKQYKTLENPEQIMEAAGVLGDMYYSKKIYDSAIYYYEKYFPNNKFSKINAANNIIEISIITGDDELIAKYAPSLAEETNKEIMLSSIKTELSSLYHQYYTNKNDYKFYTKLFKHLILISIIAVVFFIFGLNLITLKKKRYNKEISEKSEYINLLQKKINNASSENKHIKLQIKNLEDEIIDIKNKNSINYISFEQKIESIKNQPIYKRLQDISTDSTIKTNTLYPDLQLTTFEQKELIELFNTTFDNGFSKIISEHSGLKYYDMLYFCLYIIGLDEKRISAVTGKTYNAIWNRTKKIQEILGSDKKIKDIIKKELNY